MRYIKFFFLCTQHDVKKMSKIEIILWSFEISKRIGIWLFQFLYAHFLKIAVVEFWNQEMLMLSTELYDEHALKHN